MNTKAEEALGAIRDVERREDSIAAHIEKLNAHIAQQDATIARMRIREAHACCALPFIDYHEDDGNVTWWAYADGELADEPAWIGSPLDSDWPGYHTHWTPHPPMPVLLNESAATLNQEQGK